MNRFHLTGLIAILGLACSVGSAAAAPPRFERLFLDKVMRVDYFHTGGVTAEVVSLDRIVSDGPWPGSRTRLIDDTGLGVYFFEVHEYFAKNIVAFKRRFIV